MATKFFATVMYSWIHFYLDKTRVAVIIYPNYLSKLCQYLNSHPVIHLTSVFFSQQQSLNQMLDAI